ncbi:hypothetical protein V2G26_013118 [Clonostachys chloroleuca]
MQYLFLPIYKLLSISKVKVAVQDATQQHIEKRGTLEHADYFDFILPDHEPFPTKRGEQLYIGFVAVQIMLGSYSPMSDWMYSTFVFPTEDKENYDHFVSEIRDNFRSLDEITTKALTTLLYLHATLDPGTAVDGEYIPKGIQVQSSICTYTRHPRYFHEPLKFRPHRWLPSTHPLYDEAFKDENFKGYFPFSLGPRGCVGRRTAYVQAKLAIVKIFWLLDFSRVPGQNSDLERDLLHFGYLEKPGLRVRFTPVQR